MRRLGAVLAIATAAFAVGPGTGNVGTAATEPGGGERELAECGQLVPRQFHPRGGCRLQARPGRMALTVLSMFGDQPLGHCLVHYRARVGSDGRMALSDVSIDRKGSQSTSCGDFMACTPEPSKSRETDLGLPWYGRISRGDGGRLSVRFRACLDSCFGRFEGPLSFGLRPSSRHGWRLHADHESIGTSGLEISTDWELRPPAGRALPYD